MKKLFAAIVSLGILLAFSLPAFAETGVKITAHSIFFYVANGKIGFQETLYYNNPNGEEITVTVPKGAEDITSASAGGTVNLKKTDLKETPTGLETTVKVPKGNDTIELRYFMTPNDNGVDYQTKINYQTDKIQLLSTGDVVPQSMQIGQLPREKAPNGFYVVPVNPLKVGEVLQIRLFADPSALNPSAAKPGQAGQKSGTPQQQGQNAPAVKANTSNFITSLLIVLLVVLIVAAVYYFIKMRKQS